MTNILLNIRDFIRQTGLVAYRAGLVLILVVPSFSVFSQVNSFSDQYLSNLFLLNPAIAGTSKYGTLAISSKQQWSGWDGAPASQSVTFHTKWIRAKSRFTPLGFINKGCRLHPAACPRQ